MARKPVDVLAASARPQGRDAIWAAIRACRQFTLLDLEHHCRANMSTIKTYLNGLTAAGYLQTTYDVNEDGRPMQLWRLMLDTGIEAPRVTKTGEPVTQGRARQQMWQTMRAIKAFTHPDLALSASTELCLVDMDDCKSYVHALARAGYLTVEQRGRPYHPALYRFVKNTGPKAPQIQKVKQVWDPNLKQVMWSAGGDK
ncbi:MAG: hypothetical protein HYX63_13540 [Gammaproteobacteria bacterium]|nr:hypothetical protein [Gammaproteobacteria bacterium]